MNDALIAASRFGFGAGPGKPIPDGDARAHLSAQLGAVDRPATLAGMPDSASVAIQYFQMEKDRAAAKAAGKEGTTDTDKRDMPDRRNMMDERAQIRAAFLKEVEARLRGGAR